MTAASWLKLQGARSEGLLTRSLVSTDGGFGFQEVGGDPLAEADASAYRGDLSIGLGDVFDGLDGQLLLYGQTLGEGYSAPGLEAFTDTDIYGGALDLALTEAIALRAKSDSLVQQVGVRTDAHEMNVEY